MKLSFVAPRIAWLALVGGCAQSYVAPNAGEPSADLILSTTTYGGAFFNNVSTASCPSPTSSLMAEFGLTLSGASLSESAKRTSPVRPIAAGKPINLLATIPGTTCTRSATFVPMAGAAYEVTLHATNSVCKIGVYRITRTADGTTRSEPEPSARYEQHKNARGFCLS